MHHHTNEVRRIVADFSNLLTDEVERNKFHPFGPESRIFIAGDEEPDGSIRYSLLGEPHAWDYRLIADLCDSRVIEAEFGRLLANGRQLTAEKYLGLWRAAQNERLSVDQLIAAGFTLVMHATLPTEQCRQHENGASWYASPNLVSTDKAVSTWRVPLDRVDNIILAGQLTRVYWGKDVTHPGLGKTFSLQVGAPQSAATAPPPTISGELLAEVA